MWAQLHVAVLLDFIVSSHLLFTHLPFLQNLDELPTTKGDTLSIVHLGNSIQYYNDNPRLLEHMLKTHYKTVQQDSCLHGGANLSSLWEEGNTMQHKFASPNALLPDGTYDIGSPTVEALLSKDHIDVVVMNDNTQYPADEVRRRHTLHTLAEHYIPMLENLEYPTVVFLMTAAYRRDEKGSGRFGTYNEWVAKNLEGYEEYRKLVPNSKIAPVGVAYQRARQMYPSNDRNEFSWEDLYAIDDIHPSPHGSLLEAFVLYATIVGQDPPKYDPHWFDTARYTQPPDQPPLPFPTQHEALLLWEIAVDVCRIDTADKPLTKQKHLR